MVFAIGLICVYDNILNVCFASTLARDEMNPICNMIIASQGVRGFIIIKSFCTLLGISTLLTLVYTKFRISVVIMFFLSLLLFFYLTFYDHGGDYKIMSLINEKGAFAHVWEFYFSRNDYEIINGLVDQEKPAFLEQR